MNVINAIINYFKEQILEDISLVKDEKAKAKAQPKPVKIVRTARLRVFLFYVIVILLFGIAIARVIFLNIDKGEEYKRTVLSQLSYSGTTLPYQRGDIVDAKGTTLAYSQKVYNIIIDTSIIGYYSDRAADVEGFNGQYASNTVDALWNYFGKDMTADDSGRLTTKEELRNFIISEINKPEGERSRYLVFAKRQSYEKMDAFNEAKSEAFANDVSSDVTTKFDNIYGVSFEEEYVRYYPNGSLAADVIGFTEPGNKGSYGIEQYYNDYLNGTDGREFGYYNYDLNQERNIVPAVDGNTVVLTLDSNVQRIVEEKINAFYDEYANNYREGEGGAHNIGCIVMEVDTGAVLAMASAPGFDLNDAKDPYEYFTLEELQKMQDEALEEARIAAGVSLNAQSEDVNEPVNEDIKTEDEDEPEEEGEEGEESEDQGFGPSPVATVVTLPGEQDSNGIYSSVKTNALATLWSNFCVTSTYEPGSVAKPFTVAIGLDSGALSGKEEFDCVGEIATGGGAKIRCGHAGHFNVADSVAWSCNVALVKMGRIIGKENYLNYFGTFNFGQKTNIDLTGEAFTESLVFNQATMGPTELDTCAFGQGFNVTMIQMASAFCSLVNGGYYYQPRMVSKIINSDGAVVENIEPKMLRQTISNSTSEKIIEYCKGVVDYGTGKKAKAYGYSVGGKTGTAQVRDRTSPDRVCSFMGFAPTEDPKYLVYVVIDTPNLPVQSEGTGKAAGICKDIFTEILPYLNVFMTEELTEEEQAELQELGLYNANIYKPQESETVLINSVEMQIDEATGYAIDPETGAWVDPETGFPIEDAETLYIQEGAEIEEETTNE